MQTDSVRHVAVCGSTGRVGGAVARRLLEHGWRVRALTRKPRGEKARALAEIGAEVVAVDMDDAASLQGPLAGAYGVFSVQNGLKSGFDKEVRQGRNVADTAHACGVRHLVYLSTVVGTAPTGIRSWDSKLAVEAHMKNLRLPVTVLRPTAFMELMIDKAYSPAVGTWNIWPRLMGDDKPIPWIAVSDIGAVAERVFAEPEHFIGKEMYLTADVKTLGECRSIYKEVTGRPPRSSSMPLWLFDLFTRKDLTRMWTWLGKHEVPADTGATRELLPSALTVREWLETKSAELSS
ncbi:MAG TPA: NmrA/HSCARG family protein [Actinomycetota bacterium]|nr:NmrA/HSCARG family protein [Actinomycetota bacterium]